MFYRCSTCSVPLKLGKSDAFLCVCETCCSIFVCFVILCVFIEAFAMQVFFGFNCESCLGGKVLCRSLTGGMIMHGAASRNLRTMAMHGKVQTLHGHRRGPTTTLDGILDVDLATQTMMW